MGKNKKNCNKNGIKKYVVVVMVVVKAKDFRDIACFTERVVHKQQRKTTCRGK